MNLEQNNINPKFFGIQCGYLIPKLEQFIIKTDDTIIKNCITNWKKGEKQKNVKMLVEFKRALLNYDLEKLHKDYEENNKDFSIFADSIVMLATGNYIVMKQKIPIVPLKDQQWVRS